MAVTYLVKARAGAREQGPFPMKLIEDVFRGMVIARVVLMILSQRRSR